MRYFLRVLRYARPYWRWAAVSIVFTVLVSLLALLEPWPLKILFDSVLGRHPLPGPVEPLLGPLMDDRFTLMLVVVLGGFGLTLLGNGLTVVNSYVDTRLEQGMVLDFRSDLFQHAQRLSLAQHERKRAGGLIYAINFQADAAAGLVMFRRRASSSISRRRPLGTGRSPDPAPRHATGRSPTRRPEVSEAGPGPDGSGLPIWPSERTADPAERERSADPAARKPEPFTASTRATEETDA